MVQNTFEDDQIEHSMHRVANLWNRTGVQFNGRIAGSSVIDIGAIGLDPDVRETVDVLVSGPEDCRTTSDVEDAQRPGAEFGIESGA
jgi:hypothetical protein